MLYQAYQFQDDLLAPLRQVAKNSKAAIEQQLLPTVDALKQHLSAGFEMISRYQLTHSRPEFGISTVRVGNRDVPVTEEVALRPAVRQASALSQGYRYAAAEGARRCAAIGAFRDAADENLRDAAARSRCLHHRLDQRPRRSARSGQFGVDEYVDYVIRFTRGDRPGHASSCGLPAVRAGPRRRRGDGGRQEPRQRPAR